MNTAFLRLIWKEYRSQRALWLMILGISVLMGMFFAAVIGGRGDDLLITLVVSCGVYTGVFVVASVMLLFAGEEDNRTALWLRQLPMSTFTLLTAKLFASITAAVALLAACAISAVLIWATASVVENGTVIFPMRQNLFPSANDAMLALLQLSVLLSLTLLWSLVSRRIMLALLGVAVTFIAYGFSFGALRFYQQIQDWVLPAAVLIVALIICGLQVRRWHQKGLVWKLAQQGSAFAEPISIRVASPGRKLAIWLAQTVGGETTVRSRTITVLLWEQLRTAIPFVAVCVVLAALSVALRSYTEFPATFVVLGVLVVECGLRTFRGDRTREQGFFWGHRGVSSLTVLVLRHAVWLTVLGVVVVCFLAFELFGDDFWNHWHQRLHHISLWSILGTIRIPFGPTQNDFHLTGIAFTLQYALAWVLGGYTIGHVCSVWSIRPLTAAFVSLLLFCGYTALIGSLVISDVTPWLTVFPLLLCFLIAVAVTRRQWMDGRWSWKIGLQRAVLVMVPVLLMQPAVSFCRSTLPFVSVPIDVWAEFAEDEQARDTSLPDVGFERVSPEVADIWGDFETAFGSQVRQTGFNAGYTYVLELLDLPEERITAACAALDRFAIAGPGEDLLPLEFRLPWSDSIAHAVANARILDAERCRASGDLDGCLSRLLQARRELSLIGQNVSSWELYMAAVNWMQVVDQFIHQAVADDHVTEDRLLQLQEELALHDQRVPQARTIVQHRTEVWHSLMNQQGVVWEHCEDAMTFRQTGRQHVDRLPPLPRAFVKASQSEQLRFVRTDYYLQQLQGSSNSSPAKQQLKLQLRRTIQTVSQNELGTYLHGQYSWGEDIEHPGLMWFYRDAINSHRATQQIVELQLYRRQHGTFPDSLLSLTSPQEGYVPWRHVLSSGREFGFAPTGTGRDFGTWSFPSDVADGMSLSRDQPVLWADSRPSLPLTFTKDGYPVKAVVEPNRIVYLGSGHSVLRFPSQLLQQDTTGWPDSEGCAQD